MNLDEILHFKGTIIKKIRYLLYTMWYAKPARKTYQKLKFKKEDFIWYTREGIEKPITKVETPKSSEKLTISNPVQNPNLSNGENVSGNATMVKLGTPNSATPKSAHRKIGGSPNISNSGSTSRNGSTILQ